jgi:hypothetical protein
MAQPDFRLSGPSAPQPHQPPALQGQISLSSNPFRRRDPANNNHHRLPLLGRKYLGPVGPFLHLFPYHFLKTNVFPIFFQNDNIGLLLRISRIFVHFLAILPSASLFCKK